MRITGLTLADAAGVDVALDARSAQGLSGIGGLRDSRRPRPSAHGGIDETRWEDGRLIVLEVQAVGSSPEDAFQRFRAMTGPMLQTLDEGPALLKWREGTTGLLLQRMVRLASDIDPMIAPGVNQLTGQAQFYAEDPRAYAQSLVTATGDTLDPAEGGLVMPFVFPFAFTQSGGGSVSVSNGGNRPTPPVFRVYGDCTAPQILLVGTPKRVVLTGQVPAGDCWEIDVAARTVKTLGGSNRIQFLDPAATTWFELPAGASSLRLVASDSDAIARVDVLSRAAYT